MSNKEIITAIQELVDGDEFDGYIIITNKQQIKILITNYRNCCEDWGYLSTNDNVNDFLGCNIDNITLVDEALDVTKVPSEADLDSGGIIFVNINTNQGTLQFAVYNGHNGYYSHTVRIESTQLTKETWL